MYLRAVTSPLLHILRIFKKNNFFDIFALHTQYIDTKIHANAYIETIIKQTLVFYESMNQSASQVSLCILPVVSSNRGSAQRCSHTGPSISAASEGVRRGLRKGKKRVIRGQKVGKDNQSRQLVRG